MFLLGRECPVHWHLVKEMCISSHVAVLWIPHHCALLTHFWITVYNGRVGESHTNISQNPLRRTALLHGTTWNDSFGTVSDTFFFGFNHLIWSNLTNSGNQSFFFFDSTIYLIQPSNSGNQSGFGIFFCVTSQALRLTSWTSNLGALHELAMERALALDQFRCQHLTAEGIECYWIKTWLFLE